METFTIPLVSLDLDLVLLEDLVGDGSLEAPTGDVPVGASPHVQPQMEEKVYLARPPPHMTTDGSPLNSAKRAPLYNLAHQGVFLEAIKCAHQPEVHSVWPY